jgi:hypothetical protein
MTLIDGITKQIVLISKLDVRQYDQDFAFPIDIEELVDVWTDLRLSKLDGSDLRE